MGSFPETYNDPRRLRFRRSRLNEKRIRASFLFVQNLPEPVWEGFNSNFIYYKYHYSRLGINDMQLAIKKSKNCLQNGRVGIVILTYFPPAIL